MTGGVPSDPSVLDTLERRVRRSGTVARGHSGICAVPVVREGLRSGVDDHPYLQSALDSLNYHRVTPLGVKLRGIRLAIL